MNVRKSIRITPVLLGLLAFCSLIPAQLVLAASNTLYVTPSSQSLQPGQSITVQVKGSLATGSFGADTVSGSLLFPASLLKVTNVSTSGATFNWQISAVPGNGRVDFNERSFFATDNTSVFVMAVTFQALANGTANVSFSSGSQYSYSSFGNSYPTTLTGGAYTISTPPPATCPAGQTGTPPNCTTPPTSCPAGQTGTPPNCTTPPPATCPAGQTGTPPNCTTPPTNSGGTPTPTPTPTSPSTTPQAPNTPSTPVASPDITSNSTPTNGFSVSDTTVTRGYDSATLDWKTSEASKATVAYGTSLKDLSKKVDATRLPDDNYEAKITDLTPGKQYYYTITATADADATKTDSYSGVFITRGFPVVITITENTAQAANAKIKIGSQSYTTDKNGKISLELASGTYNVDIKTQGGSKSATLTVAKKTIPTSGDAPDIQRFSFDVPIVASTSSSNSSALMLLGSLLGGGVLFALLLFWLWRRRQGQDGQPQPATYIASNTAYPSAWTPPPLEGAMAPPPPEFVNAPAPGADMSQAMPAMSEGITPQPALQPDQTATPVVATEAPMATEASFAALPSPAESLPQEAFPQQTIESPSSQTVQAIEQMTIPPESAQEYSTEQPMTPTEQPQPASVEPEAPTGPAAEVIQTPTGQELQINHENTRHNSVYIDEDTPQDMFEAAKNTTLPPQA